VTGEGLLDRYVFHLETVTVPDIVEAEAGLLLREKGFDPTPYDRKNPKARTPTSAEDAAETAARDNLGPLSLFMEIRRWEPEGRVHVRFVTVDFEASLVDTKSRQVVWRTAHRGPVPTPGQVLLEAAYATAARKLAIETLAPLSPDASAPR
jgi:hypothetical protein